MSEIRKLVEEAFHENPPAQDMEETIALCEFLKDRSISSVLEIGVHGGGGLNVWSKIATPDALLVGVDISERNIPVCGKPGQRVRILIGDSHSSSIQKDVFDFAVNGNLFDFLFIDGDHSYDGVKSDFFDYAPFVEEGGIIAFHDCLSEPGVTMFIEEVKKYFELIEFTHSQENPLSVKALVFEEERLKRFENESY